MIHWQPDPILFELGTLQVSWYGCLFVTGLFCAYLLMLRRFVQEGKGDREAFIVFVLAYLGALVGARLGHCFFYHADYFLDHPMEVFFFWQGGLASHGAVVGIALALWLCSRALLNMPFFHLGDLLIPGICLVAAFVRVGNLMNSEIVGKTTDVPWAFVFSRVDDLTRHPTQIYEALVYFGLSVFLWFYYNSHKTLGKTSGYFFLIMFSTRFFIEFLKESHAPFEAGLPLNMGQLLSIPLALLGGYLVLRAAPQVAPS